MHWTPIDAPRYPQARLQSSEAGIVAKHDNGHAYTRRHRMAGATDDPPWCGPFANIDAAKRSLELGPSPKEVT